MAEAGGMLFDTAIGRCGVSWRAELVTGVQLPGRTDAATQGRLGAAEGRQAPEPVAAAVDGMVALLAGELADLGFVAIDLNLERLTAVDRAVYEVTRTIPPGRTLTYGQVAQRIGKPGAAQAVGRSLGANPFPLVVPCHRVVGADGRLVGFSATGGTETKRRLLLIEGCPLVAPTLFD